MIGLGGHYGSIQHFFFFYNLMIAMNELVRTVMEIGLMSNGLIGE